MAARHSKVTLLAIKDKGTEQEDGNLMDCPWDTYGKCCNDDGQNKEQGGENGMT